MNPFRASLLPVLLCALTAVALVPAAAHAASFPLFSSDWSLVPKMCQSCPCGFAGVLATLQNGMNAAISLGVLIATLIVAYAGITFMTASTNPEAKSKAKNMMINAVVGLLIVLSSWLIVDFVMKALYSGADGQQGKFGPWNSILTGGDTCITAKVLNPLFSGSITAAEPLANSNNVVGSGASGGSCSPPATQTNPCSVTSMQNSCFRSRASDAASVCMKESNGNFTIRSGSDLLNKGQGPSYSWGLWQINLTVYELTDTDGTVLKCPTAFTHPCSGQYIHDQGKVGWCDSSVKDQALYNKCVAAAKKPTVNTAVACTLFADDNRFADWQCSASRCSIAGARVLSGQCAPGR